MGTVSLLASAAVCLLLVLPDRAKAADATPRDLDRIASAIRGKLVASGAGFYYAAKARAYVDQDRGLQIETTALPLFSDVSVPGPYGPRGVSYYTLAIAPDAVCGDPSLPGELSTSSLSVFNGVHFVSVKEVLPLNDVAKLAPDAPPLHIGDADLLRLRACQREVQTKVAALPFESIRVFAGDTTVFELLRPLQSTHLAERGLGDDDLITHVIITPKPGMKEAFSVDVQAVSVMQCSYEGPHLELDDWKRGYSSVTPLRRLGDRFVVPPEVLTGPMPAFPRYTRKELRRAINKNWGEPGLAPIEHAEPCSPMLRGHRFKVRYGTKVIQEFAIHFASGC